MTRALLHAGEVIRPRKDLLAGFHRHQQEDAHEFLMFTLNAMQQGYSSASQPSGHASGDTTVIRQTLVGRGGLRSSVSTASVSRTRSTLIWTSAWISGRLRVWSRL